MFYCEKCGIYNSWPITLSRSFGPCEMCGRVAACSEAPSSYLTVHYCEAECTKHRAHKWNGVPIRSGSE